MISIRMNAKLIEWISTNCSGAKLRIHVSRLRGVYNILVHIWFGLSGYDYGIYCKVSSSANELGFIRYTLLFEIVLFHQ